MCLLVVVSGEPKWGRPSIEETASTKFSGTKVGITLAHLDRAMAQKVSYFK